MVLSALGVGAAVAFTGLIGFVGLVVPHLLRLAHGPDHRHLLRNAPLLGATLMLAADLVARTVVAPAELPIGVVTAALGGPFFLWLLLGQRRGEHA
jgi:iron complex transport system permease protein